MRNNTIQGDERSMSIESFDRGDTNRTRPSEIPLIDMIRLGAIEKYQTYSNGVV